MARKTRQLSKSNIYHVLIQGYNKKEIFKNPSDKTFFVNILKINVNQNKFKLFGYCIMDNHVHLVIFDFNNMLSSLMKEIAKKYAYYINKTYEKSGKVFHDRFKSEPIEDLKTLEYLLAFIHNDPIKANIVNAPHQYYWSSYNFYYNNSEDNSFVDKKELLDKLSYNAIIKANIDYLNNNFIDCLNTTPNKTILNEEDAKKFILAFLENKNVTLEDIKSNWELRYALVKELKGKSTLSIRKMAEILTLTKGIVENIK